MTKSVPLNTKQRTLIRTALGHYRPTKPEESGETLDLIQHLIKYN
mgnify:FL=1|jgi:hypothetical protein|tara:strand:+ start:325 stop:459 length:135 start_codon:yes stop_codon:yes gene_type:complete